MEIIADLHLHSRYSRAVSPQMVIPEIAKWAKKKGIDLVGAPDWTHPLWLREMKAELVEIAPGIYQDKTKNARFILVTEISSIYSQGGQTRRIHNLVMAPSFAVVEQINESLRHHGANLMSDGRPIVGLTSIQLADLVFSISKDCLIIPAHIWTPWFSLFGSKSGFDSLEEGFGQYANQIKAIETGLSSSPAMNWRLSQLDFKSIVSFSDAHSPSKLGREATVFEIDDITRLRYSDIKRAIENQQIKSTIEFYPEEGKYHWTGHRNCQIKQSPEETKKLGASCPVCGKPLTIGVMHRVEQLADRPADFTPPNRPPFKMLVPLTEILAESLNVGVYSQNVLNEYHKLTDNFGSEFQVLLNESLENLRQITSGKVVEGINKVRQGEIVVDPGYDGVFGTVKIWSLDTARDKSFDAAQGKQTSLF